MASGGSGGGSGSGGGGSPESLEQARVIGDTFSGDVYWNVQAEAVFGRNPADVNVDYGRVFFDQTNHLFVFDSTKAGSGTIRPMSWQMGGIERMSLSASGELSVHGPVSIDDGSSSMYF